MTEEQLIGSGATALKLAVASDIAHHAPELCDDLPRSVNLLLSALARHDGRSYHHSLRVGRRSWELAAELGDGPEEILRAYIAGLLHDVGKIHIPCLLLQQGQALTSDQQRVIERHSALGARLLANFPELASFAPAVAAHHECLDGSGYPYGMRAYEIPYEAQLIAVADAVDWMLHGGRTTAALAPQPICQALQVGAGRRWNEQIAAAAARQLIADGEQLHAQIRAQEGRMPFQAVLQPY